MRAAAWIKRLLWYLDDMLVGESPAALVDEFD
jgi:hypothetical protein